MKHYTKLTLTERIGMIFSILLLTGIVVWLSVGNISEETDAELRQAQMEQMRKEMKQQVDSISKAQKHSTSKSTKKKTEKKNKKQKRSNKKQGLHSRNYFEDKEVIPENK